MHAADFFIFTLSLAAGCAAFATSFRGIADTLPRRTALAGLAGLAAALTVVEVAALWLAQTGDPWNNARLAPAIALHYGFPLYYPLHDGPVLSTVVGPVAFLAYWPIGFLPGSPTALILLGSALNIAACTILFFALSHKLARTSVLRVFVILLGAQLVLSYPSLRYSLFCIHADAPALLLGGLGTGLVIFDRAGLSWRCCLLAALCLALAVWAKQSLAPLFLALLAVASLHHGRREALRFLIASLAVGLVVSAIFVAWLGFANLRDNMFVVPANHPWRQMNLATGEVFNSLPAIGPVGHIKVLIAAALHIVRESWLLFALLAAAFADHFWHSQPGQRWPRRAWAALLVVAVALLPTAAIGRTKVGGEINHESFTVFFLVAAFLCWIASVAPEHGRALPGRISALLAVLVMINVPRALEYSGWRQAWANQSEAAYRYDLQHPGQLYFPWNPLTSLLVEDKLYHFDYGVFDRNLGGAQVSATQIAQHLPSPRPPIASFIAHHDYILRTYFPDYVERPPLDALPGWKIYGPP